MLLHLDSYDLINIFKDTPITGDEFFQHLTARNAKLVYSPETIQEIVKPNDVAKSRARLEALVTFPHRYILEKHTLFRLEFVTAIDAFLHGNRPDSLKANPFATTWQEIDTPLSLKYGIERDFLVEIVMPLLEAEPERFRNTAEDLDALMTNVMIDRKTGNNFRQSPTEGFRDAVGDTLIRLGLHPLYPSRAVINELAAWLFKHPLVCPSWRLMGETYSEFANNVGDKGQRGDPADFAHVSVIPYVNAVTLDGRMSSYVRTAVGRLAGIDARIDYDTRLFQNVSTWLNSKV
jgi:hypothetical protein